MKLKFKSTTYLSIDDSSSSIFETDWIDYKETVKDEFIVLDFIDQTNTAHHLEISEKAVNFSYGIQSFNLVLHQRQKGLFKTDVQDFWIDWYLKKVVIAKDTILFDYDILNNDQILTTNRVLIEIKDEKEISN
ncbi:Uncharacterised protein [Metamycoplasma cloacale]|uniref:Uncharacterized protein n=1 Tax=Metamycoplasma cloacale TaxID=92401 RepID=A0A2Z4LL86_9BACT|nr:hypothetical protein [Metamycoplasma cloacale]AWX42490.1 hypothetical protein DK849_00100 [Metamycoplasma cloacale]VEU79164.1 Uncharacterised protein [Metamycoplasma cloacale]